MFFKKKPPVAGTVQVPVPPTKASGKDLRSVKPGELLEHYEKLRRNGETIPVPVLMAVGDLYRDLRKTDEAVRFYLEACRQTIADEAWTSAGQMLRKAQKLLGTTGHLGAQVLAFQISLGQQMISEATQQLTQLGELIGPQQGQEIEQVIQVVEREAVVPPEIEMALADFLIRLARPDRANERLQQGIQRAKRGGRHSDAQRLEQHLTHLGLTPSTGGRTSRPVGTPTFSPVAPVAAPIDAPPPAWGAAPMQPLAPAPVVAPPEPAPSVATPAPVPFGELQPLTTAPSTGFPTLPALGDLPSMAAPAPMAVPEMPPVAVPAPAAPMGLPELPTLAAPAPAAPVGLPELPPLAVPAPAAPMGLLELPTLAAPAPVAPVGLPELPPLAVPAPVAPMSLPALPPLGGLPPVAAPTPAAPMSLPALPPLAPTPAAAPAGLPALPALEDAATRAMPVAPPPAIEPPTVAAPEQLPPARFPDSSLGSLDFDPGMAPPPLPAALQLQELEALMAAQPELPTQEVLATDGSGFGAALVQVLEEAEEMDLLDAPVAPAPVVPTPPVPPGASPTLHVYADHLADAAHDDANQVRELARTLLTSLRTRIPEEEAASHYDIGLAFLQMSMYPEAVEEFQIAFRAPHMRLRAFEGLVEALLGQGTPRLAYTLLRNLGPELPEGSAQMSAQYWMGRAAEQLGRPDEALALYEEIALVDMVFRDVATRLERLSRSS